ncbi:MAG: hypothetical protein AB8H79_20970 [Myxococcota bacterium]
MSRTQRPVLPENPLACLTGARFSIRGCRIGTRGAQALLAHPRLGPYIAQATDLDLMGNRIGDEGLAALAGSAIAPGLTSLNLSDCALTSQAVALLDAFPKLTTLDLSDNDLDPAGAGALAETVVAPSLTELDLSGNPIGSEGLGHLRRHLRADHLRLTDTALDPTLGAGPAQGLSPAGSLSVAGNNLGKAGAQALVAWGARPMQLSLQYANLDDAAFKILAAAGVLERSLYADLRGNSLTILAIQGVAWRDNANVKLGSRMLDWDDFKALKLAYPKVRFSLDAITEGEVLTCPYCMLVHDLSQLRCPHCAGDLTRDASTEEPAEYEPVLAEVCVHCDAGVPSRVMRCGSCQSWTPRVAVR